LEDLRVRIPTSWWRVKKALSALKVDFVSFHDYRELCRECGESDGNAQEELASRLHDLGVAINFRTDPRLTETHVLNPHWVTGGIYAILSSPHLSQQKGELRLQELSNILDTRVYPVRMHMFLMDLMKKFELCFSFPDDEWRYLVPELLDKQEPEEVSEFDVDDCLNFEFHYSIIPEGLLPRFIVRSCVLSSGQQRWRTGAILRFEGNQALVRADIEQKIVSVSVGGPVKGRTRLLAVIRSDFDRIHQGISGLNPRQIVPVPGYPAAVAPYDDLRVWEAEGRSTYAVRIGDRVIDLSVKELLEGVELTPRQENAETTKRHPLRLFCSYSHKDETLRAELDTHLKLLQRLGVLKVWHDRRIDPGRDWSAAIDRHAEEADVVLLLVSADFLASDYCYEVEMKQALARHNRGELKVVPVIVRDVNWASAPFAKLQVLPRNGVPVASFPDRDAAWREVSDAVERMAL
jgi:internalin A